MINLSEIRGNVETLTLKQANSRYLVPDLSPENRGLLKNSIPKVVFVAESPHISEIEPLDIAERRPLCGMAGKQWWGLLTELLEGTPNSDVSLKHLLDFCLHQKLAVMNAVQFPLDPKITRLFPQADPVKNLGFCKASGEYSYKKLRKEKAVQSAIQNLKQRLHHPSLEKSKVHCLGNDSEWFVLQALGKEEAAVRLGEKIPHPSAWWRRGGLFGSVAREKLNQIFFGSC